MLILSSQIVAPVGEVSKEILLPILARVVVVVSEADTIPIGINRSRNTRQTKKGNRFIPEYFSNNLNQ
jgi:hypothetical protein